MKQEDRIKVAFGKAVRKVREASGSSQERLAELAGLHRTYIGNVERGSRNISLVNMSKVAKALGYRQSKLLWEVEKYLRR